MYCELPKVGSSNWKRVLIKLTDDRFKDIRNVLAIRKPRKLEHYNLRYITGRALKTRSDTTIVSAHNIAILLTSVRKPDFSGNSDCPLLYLSVVMTIV